GRSLGRASRGGRPPRRPVDRPGRPPGPGRLGFGPGGDAQRGGRAHQGAGMTPTPPKRYLPVALNLEGRPVLVVGAGAVGTQKVLDFLACGAVVTVVSPVASEAVRREAAAGRVRWLERRYEPGDAEGQFFVMVATDDPEANA